MVQARQQHTRRMYWTALIHKKGSEIWCMLVHGKLFTSKSGISSVSNSVCINCAMQCANCPVFLIPLPDAPFPRGEAEAEDGKLSSDIPAARVLFDATSSLYRQQRWSQLLWGCRAKVRLAGTCHKRCRRSSITPVWQGLVGKLGCAQLHCKADLPSRFISPNGRGVFHSHRPNKDRTLPSEVPLVLIRP